jgi:hypothetical protein
LKKRKTQKVKRKSWRKMGKRGRGEVKEGEEKERGGSKRRGTLGQRGIFIFFPLSSICICVFLNNKERGWERERENL